MTCLVDTDTTDNALLPKNSNSPFYRALFDAKDSSRVYYIWLSLVKPAS